MSTDEAVKDHVKAQFKKPPRFKPVGDEPKPKRLEALLKELKEERDCFARALDEVEAEVVSERAIAIEARNDAADAEERTREVRLELGLAQEQVEELQNQVAKLEDRVEELEEELKATTVREALEDYLASLGLPSNPVRVEDPALQALVDRVLN